MAKRISFSGYLKRLRTFHQFKNMPEDEFQKRATELYNKKYGNVEEPLENQQLIENSVGVWLNQNEANEAEKIFNTYIEKNSITNYSDIALLKNLVNYEIQLKRIQNSINRLIKESVDKGKTPPVPTRELGMMNEVNEQIIDLKRILGLSDEKRSSDPLSYINSLKKKFKIWMQENQATRTICCPHCSKMIMLKMRIEAWETLAHPFFKDKVLANFWAWKCYKEEKITSLDLAKILLGKDVNTDLYVRWLGKKIYGVKENKDPLLESGQILKESGII